MWTCPKCERELISPNQTHYCKKVSMESLFEGKSNELIYIFDYLLAQIIDWEDIAVSTTPNCIVFVHRQTFLVVRPMKKELEVKFYAEFYSEIFPIKKSIAYAGKYVNYIRLSSLEEVTLQVIELIRKSYLLL